MSYKHGNIDDVVGPQNLSPEMQQVWDKSKAMQDEITDADRWAYVRDELARTRSLHMSGKHWYAFRHFRERGCTFTEAVDNAIRAKREGGSRQ